MQNLYYVLLSSFDTDNRPVPNIISVFADNIDDARALLVEACKPYLAAEVNFGEVRLAPRLTGGVGGFIFLCGAKIFETKEQADADALARRTAS